MSSHNDLDPVEQYRSYLLLLARLQLEARRQHKVEASDVVQHTLLEAYRQRQQFVGDEAGFAAWLRQALANNIRDALRARAAPAAGCRPRTLAGSGDRALVRSAGRLFGRRSVVAERRRRPQ